MRLLFLVFLRFIRKGWYRFFGYLYRTEITSKNFNFALKLTSHQNIKYTHGYMWAIFVRFIRKGRHNVYVTFIEQNISKTKYLTRIRARNDVTAKFKVHERKCYKPFVVFVRFRQTGRHSVFVRFITQKYKQEKSNLFKFREQSDVTLKVKAHEPNFVKCFMCEHL